MKIPEMQGSGRRSRSSTTPGYWGGCFNKSESVASHRGCGRRQVESRRPGRFCISVVLSTAVRPWVFSLVRFYPGLGQGLSPLLSRTRTSCLLPDYWLAYSYFVSFHCQDRQRHLVECRYLEGISPTTFYGADLPTISPNSIARFEA